MKRYVGITVGPIYETLNLSSSPASLWAASYFFSSLTKSICEILTAEYGVAEKQIISPFFCKDEPLLNQNDGVGLFHDRVIFDASDFDVAQIEAVKEKALQKTADLFTLSDDMEFLREYVQIASVVFHAENPIAEGTLPLNCLELARPYVFRETENPLVQLFTNSEGEERGRNEAIKRLTQNLDGFQLAKSKTALKSIQDIVKTGSGFKKYHYYAIVRADGDHMGRIIRGLETDEKIRDFSKACLSYCAEVSKLVGAYDGVTIYAGGDDLLAILPCESKGGKSVFAFISELNRVFRECFEQNELPATTLSASITIAFKTYPLYEALEQSTSLLFDVAKKYQNCTAFHLQKRSGQSVGLVISHQSIDMVVDYLEKTVRRDQGILLSSAHKIREFERLFELATSEKQVRALFINLLDARESEFMNVSLPKLFWSIKTQGKTGGIYAITDQGVMANDGACVLQYLLRMLKFFVEKGGERE